MAVNSFSPIILISLPHNFKQAEFLDHDCGYYGYREEFWE